MMQTGLPASYCPPVMGPLQCQRCIGCCRRPRSRREGGGGKWRLAELLAGGKEDDNLGREVQGGVDEARCGGGGRGGWQHGWPGPGWGPGGGK